MVRHLRSWLLPHAEAACPSVSRYLLLAARRRASSRLCAVCALLSLSLSPPPPPPPRWWPAGSRCWWPSVQTSSIETLDYILWNFSYKSKRSWTWARKKGKDLFLFYWEQVDSFKGHVRRTDSVYSLLGIRSIRGRLDVEACFTQLILELLTDRPTKACEKFRVSGKADTPKGEF